MTQDTKATRRPFQVGDVVKINSKRRWKVAAPEQFLDGGGIEVAVWNDVGGYMGAHVSELTLITPAPAPAPEPDELTRLRDEVERLRGVVARVARDLRNPDVHPLTRILDARGELLIAALTQEPKP